MALASDKSRVLVVDDEPQITRVLRTVLTSQGYQVQTAAEGESALSNFKEWRPELVITDLYMPHMDGVELCKRIRAVSTVPIIVLSVKGEERTKVEALDSGADDYVTKPFGIDELIARVRAALRRGDRDDRRRGVRGPATSRSISARAGCTPGGQEVRLTPKEFELFVYMARHPNRVITHARCSKRCGARRRRNSRSICASSWASCARNSSPTRPTRATSSPNPGSATASIRRADDYRSRIASRARWASAKSGFSFSAYSKAALALTYSYIAEYASPR